MQDDGKCIMYDPQYSTSTAVAGPWDRGIYGIASFERDHQCSKFCRRLGLDLVKRGQLPKPPRPTPRPAVKLTTDGQVEDEGQTSADIISKGLAAIDPALLDHRTNPITVHDLNGGALAIDPTLFDLPTNLVAESLVTESLVAESRGGIQAGEQAITQI